MFGLQMINEMESFQREMDQIFRGCGLPSVRSAVRQEDRLNWREGDEDFVVETPLPGIDVEKLEISVLGRRLTLSGERTASETAEDVTWHRQERDRSGFRQTLLLPMDVDSDKVNAEYKNGILRISLPKAASAIPKKISIKAA